MSKKLIEIRVFYEDSSYDSFSPSTGWNLDAVLDELRLSEAFNDVIRVILEYD